MMATVCLFIILLLLILSPLPIHPSPTSHAFFPGRRAQNVCVSSSKMPIMSDSSCPLSFRGGPPPFPRLFPNVSQHCLAQTARRALGLFSFVLFSLVPVLLDTDWPPQLSCSSLTGKLHVMGLQAYWWYHFTHDWRETPWPLLATLNQQ